MGYTHYFTIKAKGPTDSQWEEIRAKVSEIIVEHHDLVCRESDRPKTSPEVSNAAICFNGIGELGHETFCLHRLAEGFQFCKTALKPYDRVVVKVLQAVHDIYPEWLDLSSDGDEENNPIFKIKACNR
jgi:hypothetical protein